MGTFRGPISSLFNYSKPTGDALVDHALDGVQREVRTDQPHYLTEYLCSNYEWMQAALLTNWW